VLSDDLIDILSDIRDTHKQDAITADGESAAEVVSKYLQTAMNYEGSPQEKQTKVYRARLGIDYDAITKDEFVALIGILQKSEKLRSRQGNQRGRKSSHRRR